MSDVEDQPQYALTCGSSGKNKRGTIEPSQTSKKAVGIKSPTGGDAREFAQKHGDKTQAQMASLWAEGVTQQNISDALHKLGISRKKKPMAIENETNSSVKSFKRD